MTSIQTDRFLHLATPLADESLRLLAFRGREAMSELFRYEIEFVSKNLSLAAADLVGQGVTFSIRLADDSFRHFSGVVQRLVAGDEGDEYRTYRAEVVPWLWFLTRSSDCRIFQKKPLDAILEDVFSDLGFTDYEIKLGGQHPRHEYCVQYRETDFAFVSRLMEQEGVFYYFRHEAERHVMVISDKPSAYFDLPESEVDYPPTQGSVAFADHIQSWEHDYEFRTGRFSQTDYNFENPSGSLMTQTKAAAGAPGMDRFEFYDYPGVYATTGDGGALTDLRIEEEECRHDVVRGTSTCRTFAVGGRFTVGRHRSQPERGKKYVIRSIEHEAREANPFETSDEVLLDYRNAFTCIPEKVPSRPGRVTQKPVVHGMQTAVVVGPAGEEIYTDKHGRVKVQFHWDRLGKKDESSSCWVRVSQAHAGKGFGGIDIPRIGEEVIVGFLEGDPDRPIILGRVYHAENMPPYPLPDGKVISGIKSKTYKGDGYNEIILDDTPGKELIRIHAQYDMDSTVLNDARETIKRDETVTIGRDRSETIKRRASEVVWAEKDVWVGAGFNTQVLGEMNELVVVARGEETLGFKVEYVGQHSTETVKKNKKVQVGRNYDVHVKKDASEVVDGQKTVKIKEDLTRLVESNHFETVTEKYQLKAKEIHIEADEKLVLKVGDTVVTLTKEDLQTDSPSTELHSGEIVLDSRGEMYAKAAGKLDMDANDFFLQAPSGTGEIKAGLVKINC